MKVQIYSKDECDLCEAAMKLCNSEGFDYEKIKIDREDLKKLCGGR